MANKLVINNTLPWKGSTWERVLLEYCKNWVIEHKTQIFVSELTNYDKNNTEKNVKTEILLNKNSIKIYKSLILKKSSMKQKMHLFIYPHEAFAA